MSNRIGRWALRWGALALTHLPASAQTKVTMRHLGHRDRDRHPSGFVGPIKFWGVGIQPALKWPSRNQRRRRHPRPQVQADPRGQRYDPKRAVLAFAKMIEKDKIFAMVAPMGSAGTVLAAQTSVRCWGDAAVSAAAADFTSSRSGQAARTT